MSSAQKLNNANPDTVHAEDVVVVADEENQKKTVPEEKKVMPEEGNGNGWLIGGIVGGVIMTIGIGVLTSMVVKGKNDNQALVTLNEELSAQLVRQQQQAQEKASETKIQPPVVVEPEPVKETETPVMPPVLTPPEKMTKQIEDLKTTRQQIVNLATEMIRTDLATQVSEVELQPSYLAWQQKLDKYEWNDPELECFDCDYAKLELTDGSTYFGQIKNGQPHGRGANMNPSHDSWQISEGYYDQAGLLGQYRYVWSKSKTGVATVVERNLEGENTLTKYRCDRETKECELKVEEQRALPEDNDFEEPEGDDFGVDEESTEIEGGVH